MKTIEEIYDTCKEFENNNLRYKLDWNQKFYSEEEINKIIDKLKDEFFDECNFYDIAYNDALIDFKKELFDDKNEN